ncbi:MAG: shikimate kinase [Clostridiales bacterium]|nr:shikimate kinase [Clostridiales bacterium]
MKKIVLIGFAASGKSSVGKLIAERLNMAFVDTDVEIERELGMTVQQIFDKYGEEFFRQKENEILAGLVGKQNTVVACGGGSVLAESFAQLELDSLVILLTATAATVKRRLGNTSRPLFDNLSEDELADFIAARAPLYRRHADVTFPTDNLTPEQVATAMETLN